MIIVSSYLKGEKWQITLLFNPGNMISQISFSLVSSADSFAIPAASQRTHTRESLPMNSSTTTNFQHSSRRKTEKEKIHPFCINVNCICEGGWRKNYNNVQVIFIRVETGKGKKKT